MHSLIRTTFPPRVLPPDIGGPRLFGRCIRHTDWPHGVHGFKTNPRTHELSHRWTAILRPSIGDHQGIDRFSVVEPPIPNLTTKIDAGSRVHNPWQYQHIECISWLMCLINSSSFVWPIETKPVDEGYLHFVAWAEAGGGTLADWYSNTAGGYRDSNVLRTAVVTDEVCSCLYGYTLANGACTDLCVGVTCPAPAACHTQGVCSYGTCSEPVLPDETPCAGGACQGGICTPPLGCNAPGFSCDDGNVCTTDSCDTVSGLCVHTPADGTSCGSARCEGLTFYPETVCSNGACPAQVPQNCNDNTICTSDVCNASSGGCINSYDPSVDPAASGFQGGRGTAANPYIICTAGQLNLIGVDATLCTKYFKLAQDIDLNGVTFNIIGSNSVPFIGSFDGDNKKISNLTLSKSGQDYIGLVGCMRSYGLGVVKNVGLQNVSVTGNQYVGGLVGFANTGDGTHLPAITNSFVSGSVSGSSSVGGLAGYVRVGSVSVCYATDAVTGVSKAGGLIGNAEGGAISDSHATGAVSGTGNNLGGFVGYGGPQIANSYATGAVTGGNSSSYLGGLVGNYAYATTITNSHATGAVVGGSGSNYLGGLVGYNDGGTINGGSYATGAVTGGSGSGWVGGLIGSNRYGIVADSYSTGMVTGGTGGLVGGLLGSSSTDGTYGGTISNCHATGNVTGVSGSNVGGLAGYVRLGSVSRCYAAGTAVSGVSNVGGLIGQSETTITRSYATASASGTGNSIGGLVGYGGTPLSNSYATGAVTGGSGSYYLGGLVGNYAYGTTVTNAYSTGAVTGGAGNIGGLIGRNDGGTFVSSYWNKETSGKTTSAGGTGKTTAEMKQQATFTGWDFATIWNITEGTSYPFLL